MRYAVALALLLGCSEYEMDGGLPPVDAPEAGGAGGAAGGGSGDGSGGGGGGGQVGDVPDEFTSDDCGDGVLATWSPGEVAVLSWDGAAGLGTFDAPVPGTYHVYDLAIAESGDRQWNESAWLRVRNATNPEGTPMFSNCGDDWVVMDPDNFGPVPAGEAQLLGTFWLDAGPNDVEIWHYCDRYRAGECTSLHNTDDPGSTCDSGSPNSVHFTGASLCLRRAE